MSFSDPPKLAGWRKAVVVAAFLIALLAMPLCWLVWALVSCPAFAPVGCVSPSTVAQWIIFPGAPILLLVVAFALRRAQKREPRA